MSKISKRFLCFVAVALFFVPVTISQFTNGDTFTGIIGILGILILVLLGTFFQLRKLRSHQIIDDEEILEEIETELENELLNDSESGT